MENYVEVLIGIGEADGVGSPAEPLAQHLEESGINREHPTFWKAVCLALPDDKLLNLFRGAIIAEKEFGLSGGSVSANIWILRQLSGRLAPQHTYDAIAWALENRTKHNTYTPFGTMHFEDFRDVFVREGVDLLRSCSSDYLRALSQRTEIRRNEAREARAIARRAREQADRESAEQRWKGEAPARAAYARAAMDRRAVMVSELTLVSPMDMQQRLQWILQTDVPLSAIPESLFEIQEVCAHYRGSPELDLLKAKLRLRKGHWTRLARVLRENAKRDL